MVTMKGNNGKGARRKLLHQLYAVIAVLIVTCIVLYSLLLQGDEHSHRSVLPDSLDPGRALKRNHPRKKPPRPVRKQRPPDDQWNAVLEARLHLVELVGLGSGDPSELTAGFCRLEWHLHKKNPSTYPMFRDLVGASESCEDKVWYNFQDIVNAAKQYDAANQGNVLELGGVVFHESRCGSTLTANLLATWHPDQHRVYSESTPPIQALTQVCGNNYEYCSMETAASVLKDVVYLMSRSDDTMEERVFFKIQSAGTRNVAVFQHAFPEVPYLFVYRDPVQVMMSHLAHGVKNANCLRNQHRPLQAIKAIFQKYGPKETPEDFCAAHLASITETIASSLTEYAIPINYRDMPDILFDSVFPQLLDEEISEEDLSRMRETAGVYSKGRGNKQGVEFAGDSQQKEESANERVRAAAERYLIPSYKQLEAYQHTDEEGDEEGSGDDGEI